MNPSDETPKADAGASDVFGFTALKVVQALDDLTQTGTMGTEASQHGGRQAAAGTSQHGVGTIAFRRFCLQRVLGRGGMGIVWLALDMKLERTVALKFLPDLINADASALQELKDETRRGLDLAHPNIVRIYDFVDDSESAAISMEYVDGRSLHDAKADRPQRVFSTEEITPWLRQLCEALEYAHEQRKIIHRDLKPANLMVNSSGQLKITDFGIARSLTDTMSRVTGANSGTLLYMSPQQSLGERPCPTDDVYSVGATIYDLLTGKPPFFRGDVAMQVASKIPPSMAARRAEFEITVPDVIPPEWEETVAACLDKDPTYRPQSAMEIAARLGFEMKGETKPIVVIKRSDATRTSATSLLLHPRSQLSFLMMSAITLVCVLALGAGALIWWNNRSGSWSVETFPPGAYVSIGDVTQVAPARFDHLKPGTYQAEITLDNYAAHPVEFTVKPGQVVDFGVVNLHPNKGNIALTENNEGDAFEVKSVATAIVPPQSDVGQPPNGFWNLKEVFVHSEYAGYSDNGRSFLLQQAQLALQELGALTTPVRMAPNEQLHEAIKSFQASKGLMQNGLLDSATIIALGIEGAPDKADWVAGAETSADQGGWWTRNVSRPLGRLFGGQSK